MTATSPPVVSIDKWGILDQCGWNPHPAQLRMAESTARHRVVAAGRRAGKSDWGGHELVPEALATAAAADHYKEIGKRREFWIVGPEYSDSEKEFRVLYNVLSRLQVPFDKPGTYNDPIGGSLHLSLWDGAFQVHGKSAKYPDSLTGEGLHGVIMAEAAKMKERIWTKYIRPMLADYDGWSIHGSTPEGKNWFHGLWKDGQDPSKSEWFSIRMPAWVNPYVYKNPTKSADVERLLRIMGRGRAGRDPFKIAKQRGLVIDKEIISLVSDMTEESFRQEIGADFSEFVGRVFKGFDEEIHVGDFTYNPRWQTYACVDYGFRNPNVWLLLQVGPWGEVRILDEVYEYQMRPDEFAEEIARRELAPRSLKGFYPDPEDPGASAILSEYLKVPILGGTGGELRPRLDAIRKALVPQPRHLPDDHPEKKPQLMFDRKCSRTIADFLAYRYPEKRNEESKVPELPLKKDDHGPEAVGRFFAGFFLTPEEQAMRTRQSKARYR